MKLLFDLDGTLTDPYEGITRCIAHALTALGRPSPHRSKLRWCIGPPLRQSFAILLGSNEGPLLQEAVSVYRERFSTVGMFENEVYEGIPGALQALLKNGHRLYVATSKPTVYAEQIINHFELHRYFAGVYGSELDGTRNDKTHLISYILQRASINASCAAMIGDREHDMIGANGNGVGGFGVLWGYGSRQELKASGACACIGSPGELVAIFNGIEDEKQNRSEKLVSASG
jgi:phosphoglycolate phosphatase